MSQFQQFCNLQKIHVKYYCDFGKHVFSILLFDLATIDVFIIPQAFHYYKTSVARLHCALSIMTYPLVCKFHDIQYEKFIIFNIPINIYFISDVLLSYVVVVLCWCCVLSRCHVLLCLVVVLLSHVGVMSCHVVMFCYVLLLCVAVLFWCYVVIFLCLDISCCYVLLSWCDVSLSSHVAVFCLSGYYVLLSCLGSMPCYPLMLSCYVYVILCLGITCCYHIMYW